MVEYTSTCRLHPSWWLVKLGLNRGFDLVVSKAAQGWQHAFKIFYPVLDNAVVFDFVRTGDIESIKALLIEGKASVWDVNSREQTPLHIAVQTCNVQLCEMLLNVGADPETVAGPTIYDENYPETPLSQIDQADGPLPQPPG